MGKASKRKRDRRDHLDSPAVIEYRSDWPPDRAERLAKFREYLAGVDAKPGGVVEFAHVYSWREMRQMQLDLVKDLEGRDQLTGPPARPDF